jgi:hypothetical protein
MQQYKNKPDACVQAWCPANPVVASLPPYILTVDFQHLKITTMAVSIIHKSLLCAQ